MDAEYKFGDLKTTPYSEPAWYDSRNYSPYYTDAHREWRQVVRTFVDTEIMPYRDEWDAKGKIPDELFVKAGKIGLLAATVGWPDGLAPLPRPKGYDTFFSVIAMDELSRCGSSGIVWGLVGGMGISLHPLIHADSEVAHAAVKKVLTGEWKSCLAVSEAQAGSDVANLTTTAVEEGDNLIINGNKKWITCGLFSDVMVAAVKLQDGSKGFAAIRLVLVPSRAKGVTIREMDCMGAKGSGTAFIEYDDVVVPKANIIGGADQLLSNFVGERLGIALQATRFARVCLAESIEYVRRRKAFGKPLEEQPVVRQQIAEMAKRVESTWAWIESVVGRVVQMEREETNWFEGIMRMGAEAALLKVQGSEVFEFCAAQAALLHGGNSYVRGNRIEHLYRAVISLKIPGGAPAPIQDSAMRLALKGKL